jgi:hypothetical protein
MLHGLLNALSYPVHQAERGARFMGDLSHASNTEEQANYIAQGLRARGIPDHIAWPAAHQFAYEQGIHRVSQQPQALAQLAALLQAQGFHHR